MTSVLKVIDVVDIGIEKEKARQDFYNQVASAFDDTDMKDLFTKLRDWEAGHVVKFESIRDELKQAPTHESYPGEATAYIKALVDDSLYQQVKAESFAKNVSDPVEAINYGIGFEKDAILLFQELLQFVQSKNKDAIMKLIEEERHHIVQLIKIKSKFK